MQVPFPGPAKPELVPLMHLNSSSRKDFGSLMEMVFVVEGEENMCLGPPTTAFLGGCSQYGSITVWKADVIFRSNSCSVIFCCCYVCVFSPLSSNELKNKLFPPL